MQAATDRCVVLNHFFTWKVILTFVGGGISAVSLALAWLDSLWGNICFSVAYVAVAMATASAAGTLIKKIVSVARCRSIHKGTRDARHPAWTGEVKIYGLRLLTASFAVIVGLGLFYVVHFFQVRFELRIPEGILYPANDPMPDPSDRSCLSKMADNEVAILTGGNIYLVNSFPTEIFRIQGKDSLVIGKSDDGAILITLDIFDSLGRLVTHIENGKFKYKQEWLFDWKRDDKHTLELFDFQNRTILKIRYLNKQVIAVDAVLRYPGISNPIILEGSKTSIHGSDGTKLGMMAGFCIRRIDNSAPLIEFTEN